jgi:hypothetical protein
MRKNRGVRVDVLVEDRALERLACSVLAEFGFGRREIRVEPYPVGKNAKQWVTREYPRLVRAYRRHAAEQVALLVGTEADEQTVLERRTALERALKEAKGDPRTSKERIVLWIPKWNVETWFLFLSGEDVDEYGNYKHAAKITDVRTIAKDFVRRYRDYQREESVVGSSSLQTAFQETTRLNV